MKCQIEDCNKIKWAKGYCNMHYWRLRNLGSPHAKTIFTKNEIVIKKNYAEIILTDKKFIEVARSKIDIRDIPLVSKYKWRISHLGYINRTNYQNGAKHSQTLGELLIGKAPHPLVIDHKNRNPLDNRKQNLRFATKSNNGANRKNRGKTSKYKGVRLYRDRVRWVAYAGYFGVNIYLGIFSSELKAARAYDEMAVQLHGEYAYQNFG
jgi:hypothetical protein